MTTDTQDPSAQTDTQDPVTTAQNTATASPPDFSWKSQLNPDFANSPTMQKYSDTKEGFNDAVKSHLELQKLLGHEKVPVPKGPDDTVAMNLFRKAMRVPEKADGYALPDVEIPDAMQGLSFNKNQFQEIIHKNNLSPEQAKGLWNAYTEISKTEYANAMKMVNDQVAETVGKLRTEWGDAYQSKVDLGQMVIKKFSDDQAMNDFVTASLVKNPLGVKFLAKIGEQFAENKVGDFKYQRHSLSPDEAQREIDAIRRDLGHPYNNEKAPQAERDRAIEYVNSLYSVVSRGKTR